MKKFYYFLVLIGIVSCTTSPVDVYDGEKYEYESLDAATITYDTDVDGSLRSQLIRYFGEAFESRTNLKVTLSGRMDKSDFADIKGLKVLDMSGVTLIDGIIPSNAFVGSSLDTLILPATGTVKTIEDNAMKGLNVTSITFPAEVESFGQNLFDDDTLLKNIYVGCDSMELMPSISANSFPSSFLLENQEDDGFLDVGATEVVDKVWPAVWLPNATRYFYKQDPTWSKYNVKEPVKKAGAKIVVNVESSVETGIADLEAEIIELAGEKYATINNMDLYIKGTLIAEDFDIFFGSRFRTVDFSEAKIEGDILVFSADVSGTDHVDMDMMWPGNAIPEKAFANNSVGNLYLQTLVLPADLEAVGYWCFRGCKNLKNLSFPEGCTPKLELLADGAFSQCAFPNLDFIAECDVESLTLGSFAFGGNANITSVSIPEFVDSMGIEIINASSVLNYVLLNWTEEENILTFSEKDPPFPSQFYFGNSEFITIPAGTREKYEAKGWGFFNLIESGQTVLPKQWRSQYFDDFDYTTIEDFQKNWSYEAGYVRDYEKQYYTQDGSNVSFVDNTSADDGKVLKIEARKETTPVANEFYVEGSSSWKTRDEFVNYTSASVKSKYNVKFARVYIRARFPMQTGVLPTISALGTSEAWPMCGQTNIATYYNNKLNYEFEWAYTAAVPYRLTVSQPSEPAIDFANEFHTWLYDWTAEKCDIYLFDETDDNMDGVIDSTLVHSIDLFETVNDAGTKTNPFKTKSQNFRFNLALGGRSGAFDELDLPVSMEIDWIDVQREEWQFYSPKN